MSQAENPRSPIEFVPSPIVPPIFSKDHGSTFKPASGGRVRERHQHGNVPEAGVRKGLSAMRVFEVEVERGQEDSTAVLWKPGEVNSLILSSTTEPFSRVIHQNGVWEIGFADRSGTEGLKSIQYDLSDGSLLLDTDPLGGFGNAAVPSSLKPEQIALLSDVFQLLGFPQRKKEIGIERAEAELRLQDSQRVLATGIIEITRFHSEHFLPESTLQPALFEY